MVKEFGYEYDAVIDTELWCETKGLVTNSKFCGAVALSSGRDALKVIAREHAPCKVYISALACESMISPFIMYGHNVCFYRLNKDFSIDFEFLKNLIDGEGIFLFMDYFGISSMCDTELCRLKLEYPKLIFVEDRTHNFLWNKKRKFVPNYTIASIRKWVNVPDGGLLWHQNPLKCNDFSDDISFSTKRLEAQCMRYMYLKNGDESIKKAYRSIFASVSEIIDKNKLPVKMSLYAYEMIKKTNWNYIRKQRKRNARVLMDILSNKVDFIQNENGVSDISVAVAVNDRDNKQQQLSSLGIFNTIIWPISKIQKEVCKVAKYATEHMLAVPCDQRYTESDMEFIGREMVRIFNE